jgi:thioredoxin:protein disulfide reductase
LKRPLLIDFSAEWCAACKELEKYVFADDRFEREAGRFVLARVDGTNPSPALDELYARYSVDGLPTVVMIDSDGKVREDLTVKGFLPAQEFVALLQKVH